MASKSQKKSKPPKRPAPRAPALPAYIPVLAGLPERATPSPSEDELEDLEAAFGFAFPAEVKRLMVGLARFDLMGGAANPLTLAQLRQLNALDGRPDATSWATSRLGLWVVAADELGNRLCVDLVDPSGQGPVYLCTVRMGLAAAATPIFPAATDLLHAFALYTAGAPARQAAEDVEKLSAKLEELRKKRPGITTGRNEALLRLQAAFGGGAALSSETTPSAEDEGRLANELEAAREAHKQLWMPFMEQFARWHIYWRLLWNGANSLTFQTDVLDQPLVDAWRAVLPLAAHITDGRVEALRGELAQRTAHARTAVAFADAWVAVGEPGNAEDAMKLWDAVYASPRPPRAAHLLEAGDAADVPRPENGALDWGVALKLSRKQAERFLSAVGAQFAADLKKHGTTNVLGATKAAVRRDGMGRNIVEAGFGHVPLEVRKALFEGRQVELPGQFLQALTRELTRRLHQPARSVERTLTRLRLTLQEAINLRAPLAIPHVGTFRIKNEPAPTGQSRFYLLLDPVPALVEAAQSTVIHEVSARPDEGFFL
jgi:hypothetical protein